MTAKPDAETPVILFRSALTITLEAAPDQCYRASATIGAHHIVTWGVNATRALCLLGELVDTVHDTSADYAAFLDGAPSNAGDGT